MRMPRSRAWLLCAVFGVGCSTAPDDSSANGGRTNDAAGGRADASGGTASGGAPTAQGGTASGGTSTAQGGSTSGGRANGGSSSNTTSGGANSASGGTASAGASAGGRNSGGGRSGRGGGANASGGASASGGSVSNAGAGSCVQNLGCMLTAPASTGDIHQDCVDRVNQFRTQCACLPALARWTDGEACADQEAQYDSEKNTAHAGFSDNICKSGQGQNECPGWGSNAQVISGCLQQMWNEGPPPTSSCSGDCFNQHGHYINMTSTSSTKVACGFYTTANGKIWAVQNFSK